MADSSIPRTAPAEVNGLPVAASVRLPDIAGYPPARHVVACRDARTASYVVWRVAWSGGSWVVAGSGRYDLRTLSRAVDVVAERVKEDLAADGLR